MKIAVVGSGKIGKSLGGWLAAIGNEVTFAATTLEHAQAAAELTGHGSKAAELKDAVAAAEMLLLAVPYRAVAEIISEVKPLLKDKIIIDPTNAMTAAKVIKAFNTLFAMVYATHNPLIDGHKATIIYAGDDAEAKGKLGEIITTMGFNGIDGGPHMMARYIEPMGALNIILSSKGQGPYMGFCLLQEAKP
jgi:predicted dinucleotide-binding enzyme